MAKKLSNSSKKANAPQLLRKPHAKSAQASFASVVAAGALLAAIAPFAAPLHARAYPITPPRHTATPPGSPTPAPPPSVLPYGTTLSFVLDGTISSAKSKPGELVPIHLAQALVVNGVTVAPAGTQTQIKIVDASPASNPDVYGYIDIYARPLVLPDGRVIPLHAPATHLDVNVTAGHAATADIENTVGDIFAPTLLLHIFRKGRNFVLEPGATIKLRTEATVVALGGGTFAVETPAPLVIDEATPNSSFRVTPLVTVNPSYRPPMPTPEQSLTPQPRPTY